MNRKPVHIITGFLGAGKTTFLNHFIKERLPERIFVIENEFGPTSIDGALVLDSVEKVVDLTAGCLCCSLANELLEVLEEAYKQRDQYDRIVIETTGIADPSSILQMFLENPAVEKAFDLQQVICMVDAKHVTEWLQEVEESLRQISIADVVLVNKVDTVSKEELQNVLDLLKKINPLPKVQEGTQGIFKLKEILSVGTVKPESVASVKNDHHYEHGQGEKNHHKITTFTLNFPHALDLDRLVRDLNEIVKRYRGQVYRIKGFIAIPNYPNRVILQSARSAIIATDGTPWEDEGDRVGKLVFIGRGLKKETFDTMLGRHMLNMDDSIKID